MKISLNTILRFNEHYQAAGNIAPNGVDELVKKIGAQLGEVDSVEPVGDKYKGVLVVKVVSCDKHPSADKLQVCKIDDGGTAKDVERDDNGHVQVVCGAPNVREGLLAVWLLPGTTVPDSLDGEPFVLEARELRGVVSNGMLASPKELALGDSHAGIMEIGGDIAPGTSFAEALHIDGDVIIDIENKMFTHRPDCFGFMGIARELAGIQGMAFKSPAWYTPNPEFPAIETDELKLTVKNELPDLVPRFTAVTMANVEVGPSPLWLQVELLRLGQKPINNIVDFTNWYMLETGQPLHAYDYDKVQALSNGDAAIVIRNPHSDEKIKLLNGKEITPRPEAIMIATDQQAIGIGGVMGGTQTGVDNDTKNIIIESANFNMYSIRRTSMAHGLFTDAVTRFTKGQSPLQCVAALALIVVEVQEQAGGQVASPLIDNHQPDPVLNDATVHPPVEVSKDFINQRLGLQLDDEAIMKLLTNVEFDCQTIPDGIRVTAPFWRTDIELREDVVEEVGRLYGYDKLPLKLPKRDLTPVTKDPLLTLKAAIRQKLAAAGANEILTYSFVHGDLIDKAGQDKSKAFQISNALSPDLQYYRPSLMPSLLDKVRPNIKAGYSEFALFELGKTHNTDSLDQDGLPQELDVLSLVYTSQKNTKPGAAYYEARQFLVELAASLGWPLEFTPIKEHLPATDLEPGRSALVCLKSQFIGSIGELKASVRKNLKLPDKTAIFELRINDLVEFQSETKEYVTLSRFPKAIQDITLRVPSDLSYKLLYLEVSKAIRYAKPPNTLIRLEPLDIFQKADDDKFKNITFRLTISSYDRTLTDAEVSKLLDKAAEAARAEFGAERI